MIRTLGGLLIALSCWSCGPKVVFDRTEDFGAGGWAYADSVSYSYTIRDTTARYDLVLTVSHAPDYPAQNIYLRLSTYLPEGTNLSQPISLDLADDFGRWYGDCDGEVCSTDLSIQTGTAFNDPGTYRLVAAQFTRRDPVPEVRSLGFRVIKR